MVIAVDLDGVLFDTEEYFRTYAQIYDLKFVKNGLKNAKEMNVFDRFGWDKEIANDFYEKYTAEVLNNAPIKAGAKYVLNELKNMGHNIICVTLRGFYRQCEIDITERRLKKEGIKFDKVFYSQNNKLKVCLEENVELIIEDSHKNIRLLSKNNIKCLHLKGAGLKSVRHKNVIEVQNWGDILEKILKINKNRLL